MAAKKTDIMGRNFRRLCEDRQRVLRIAERFRHLDVQGQASLSKSTDEQVIVIQLLWPDRRQVEMAQRRPRYRKAAAKHRNGNS